MIEDWRAVKLPLLLTSALLAGRVDDQSLPDDYYSVTNPDSSFSSNAEPEVNGYA